MTVAYGSRPIKRRRRSKPQMEAIREAIYETVMANSPATVRQVFYQLVSRGVIEKRESEYKCTVIRILGEMRRDGTIPFHCIADETRWMRKPRTWSSLEQALRRTAESYRRAVWDNQNSYVEVWLEKEALAGVLVEVTEQWDVPLMVTRGYPSLSFLHGAAEMLARVAKPIYLYYFGDYDPSGLDIARVVEENLTEFSYADITFERVAVTREQINAWNLPTRPTKRTDTRSRGFRGESVEVDAIPPAQLRALAEECIVQHVDEHQLESLHLAEQSERALLLKVAANASNGDGSR